MTNEGTFTFISRECKKEHAQRMEKELGGYLEVIWESDKILKVRVRNPSKSLIEFDFLPHSCGVRINVMMKIKTS